MYNTRLDGLTEYPFQRLNALLAGIVPDPAAGAPVIMSVGEPQHVPPQLALDAMTGAAAGWSKYPLTNGTPEFRQAVAAWAARRFHLPAGFLDADQHILPLSGSREGLYMAAELCVPPRKNGAQPAVLLPNPYYQVYLGAALMAGAEPVFVNALAENGFQPDTATVAPDHLARCAMAYLCTPSNPQGAMMSLEKLKAAIVQARAHDFVLLADECYSEIYGAVPPAGALRACAELGEGLKNVLVFNSLSKRSSLPGLRSGFVAGDADLIAKFARLRAHNCAGTPLPVLAAATALWGDEAHVEQNRALYTAKFDDAVQIFGNRFGCFRPDGGFFLWLDVGDSEKATQLLWREAAVKVLPGGYIAKTDSNGVNPGARYIRIALVHDRARSAEALRRVKSVLDKHC